MGLVVDIKLVKVFINGEIRKKDGFNITYTKNIIRTTPFIIGDNLLKNSLMDDFRFYQNKCLNNNYINELYKGKVEVIIKGNNNNCEINTNYSSNSDDNPDKKILIRLSNEYQLVLKKLNNHDKPYNYFNIYPLAILILILWIFMLSLSLNLINYYYSNYYVSILFFIIIIILFITSLWFLYVNNILI